MNGTEIYKFKAKDSEIDKYGYSGYGIGFGRRGSFSFPGGGYNQNVLIFGVDMSFSAHIDDKKKTLVSRIGPTQGLENTLAAEKMYSINFTVTKKKFCLSLHYNGANSYCLSMVQKFTNLKQKILKL